METVATESGAMSFWQKGKRAMKWLFIFFALVYMGGVVMIVYKWYATPAALERISAQKITRDMVMGENLPPAPDEAESNRTVAGVDANENGIRDDVELAIFARHPDSAKIRAAQLQYAQALQSQLVDVFNSKTLVAVIQETGRASHCIDTTHVTDFSFLRNKPLANVTREDLDKGNELGKQHNAITRPLIEDVDKWVLNTSDRKKAYDASYRYMTSYGGSANPEDCDVLLETLPN